GIEQPLGRHLRPNQCQPGQRPPPGLDLPFPRHARPTEGEHYYRAAQAATSSKITNLHYSCITAFRERALTRSSSRNIRALFRLSGPAQPASIRAKETLANRSAQE